MNTPSTLRADRWRSAVNPRAICGATGPTPLQFTTSSLAAGEGTGERLLYEGWHGGCVAGSAWTHCSGPLWPVSTRSVSGFGWGPSAGNFRVADVSSDACKQHTSYRSRYARAGGAYTRCAYWLWWDWYHWCPPSPDARPPDNRTTVCGRGSPRATRRHRTTGNRSRRCARISRRHRTMRSLSRIPASNVSSCTSRTPGGTPCAARCHLAGAM